MSEDTAAGGTSFVGLLTLLFIGLKLTHYIDWPWLWVLSPIWIAFFAGVALLMVMAIGFAILQVIKK
jgi:hypothetical protein